MTFAQFQHPTDAESWTCCIFACFCVFCAMICYIAYLFRRHKED